MHQLFLFLHNFITFHLKFINSHTHKYIYNYIYSILHWFGDDHPMFSATLFVKHPTPAEPGTRLAAWPRPASTATTRASCRRCWPKPCPAQRCSRRECGGEWKAGHSACGWIYIYLHIFINIYIYKIWILIGSHWVTLVHIGFQVLCRWLIMFLFTFCGSLCVWALLGSMIPHDQSVPEDVCVCVVWRHLLLDVDLWRMILLIHI